MRNLTQMTLEALMPENDLRLISGIPNAPEGGRDSGTAISFDVYIGIEPQGSKKAFVVTPKGGGKPRAVIVDDNKPALRSFRQEVTRAALSQIRLRPWAGKHVPVRLRIEFVFPRPASCPKSRKYPAVLPDVDKCSRAVLDALTSVLYQDDAQVVQLIAAKSYGPVEMVRIAAEIIEG